MLDFSGRPVGSAAKLVAHQHPGVLHSAFAVFIRDARAGIWCKGGLWASSTSPESGLTHAAGVPDQEPRRPRPPGSVWNQEMGIVSDLSHIGILTYHAIDPVSGLVEHELDELYTGVHDADPNPDPFEVEDWGWVEPAELVRQMASGPENFAPWLMIAFETFPGLLAPG